jgi:anthranilate phosphoribosyltransferase
MTMHEAIQRSMSGGDLSYAESREVFEAIMSGQTTPAQIAGFLVALHMKGETIDEITGAAEVMREKALRITPANPRYLVDTCGTGGDRSGTFNISTAAAFVAAGAGASVAKHGNRSVSSRSGSADVLEALGVDVSVAPDVMKACLDDIGICFMFAPTMHTAMRHAIGPRREIGVRTIFNILGPLTNPAFAPAQVLGVFSESLTETLAGVLAKMESRSAYVVHGSDGLDEITVCGPTQVSEVREGAVSTYEITPEQFGMGAASADSIAGGTAQENAAIIRRILDGAEGPRRDIVVLNAAFALAASGRARTPAEGVEMARQSIDSGEAREKLRRLAEITSR